MNQIESMLKVMRDTSQRHRVRSGQMTLGALIKALEPIDLEQSIEFCFGGLSPGQFMSWRGAYEELGLDYTDSPVKTGDFLALCKEALGKEFHGYKGGDFVMTEDSPIWVSKYGVSGHAALVGVIDTEIETILEVAYREY